MCAELGGELMRRRMMMHNKTMEKWNIDWNYLMGLPEDNGFTITKDGPVKISLEENGLLIKSSRGSADGVYYTFSKGSVNKCTIEVSCNFIYLGGAIDLGIAMSDGINTIDIRVRGRYLQYRKDSTWKWVNVCKIELDTDYTVKVEFDKDTGGRIYVDNSYLSDAPLIEGLSVNTKISFGYGVNVLVKSMKVKYND